MLYRPISFIHNDTFLEIYLKVKLHTIYFLNTLTISVNFFQNKVKSKKEKGKKNIIQFFAC